MKASPGEILTSIKMKINTFIFMKKLHSKSDAQY